MKYKLINRTKISRKVINELIQFSCPKGVNNFAVLIKDTRGTVFYGRIFVTSRPKKIIIYVDLKNKYPILSHNKTLKKDGYHPVVFIKNNHEAIVSLLAHELRHLWQWSVSKREFWDKKSLYKAEKDACEYTQKVLFKYRKLRGKYD